VTRRASDYPVHVRQARVGTPPNLARNVFVGYKVHNYGLSNGPVYRKQYYLHKTEVKIPEDRAIRLYFTKKIMVDTNGKLCLNSSNNYTLVNDSNDSMSSVVTEVRYEKLYGGKKRIIYGENETVTVTIDKDSFDQSVEVSSLVKYNGTIVAKTNCTQIQRVMNGTVVRMYGAITAVTTPPPTMFLCFYFTFHYHH
jgi:hypothetical protein